MFLNSAHLKNWQNTSFSKDVIIKFADKLNSSYHHKCVPIFARNKEMCPKNFKLIIFMLSILDDFVVDQNH